MPQRTRTAERARIALIDANVIAVTIDTALAAIDRGLAGWPTSTPGASPLETPPATPCRDRDCTHLRPCPIHDEEAVELTAIERTANEGDKARRELEQLDEAVRLAAHHLGVAARISQSWAWEGLTQSAVSARLVAVDAGVWCSNCVKFGEHNPREENRTECKFCREFRRDFKRPAPKQIWDARNARGGRIDVGTIDRILKRLDAEQKARRAEQKAAAAAARKAAKRPEDVDA